MPMAPGEEVTGLQGSYRLESRHGEGSFGITYRARSIRDGLLVIVKELRLEKLDDWKALELFEREGRVLATVSHPSIPAFRDFFAHGGPTPLPVSELRSYDGPAHLSLVLVQEFIDGVTLQQRVDRGERLSPADAETILLVLLQALEYLHARTPPLVHRDIKPGNVILTPDGRPYLVDFGAIQDRLRGNGSVGSTIVGTLGYMPLEQIRGDARPVSDLYALGVTMVVALAGRPLAEIPFDDATGKVSVRDALPWDASEALREALDSMIAPLLGQRAHSAAEVRSRLAALRYVAPPPPVIAPRALPAAVVEAPASETSSGARPEPADAAKTDLDVATFEESLGVRGWLHRRASRPQKERSPGEPGPLFRASIILIVGGSILLPIIMFAVQYETVLHGATTKFSSRYTCPRDRVAAFERLDLHSGDLASQPIATPPKDIAADPGRLAMWQASQPKRVTDNGDAVIDLEGCGHHVQWACHQGKSSVSCTYERDVGTPLPTATSPTAKGTSAPPASSTPSFAPSDLADGPVTVTWSGHLDASTGEAPPRGTACTLTAVVVSRGGKAEEQRLLFQCRGQTLYDSDVPLSGISDSMFDLDEILTGDSPSAYRYFLGEKDIGMRSPPRSQIMVYTPGSKLDAWRDTTSQFRVHATMDRESAERRGKPVRADALPPFDEVVTRTARVTSKLGTPPFTTASCTLRVSPAHTSTQNCRVRLDCGGHAIYGAGANGFEPCVLEGRAPKSMVDSKSTPKDGDPELAFDLDAETATLGDTSKTGVTYAVTFALSEGAADAGAR